MVYVWQTPYKSPQKLMLLAIADRCDDEGVCFPGVGTLAKKCSIGERGAQKMIAQLERMGEIVVVFNKGFETSHGSTNLYYMKQYRDTLGLKTPLPSKRKSRHGVSQRTPQEMSYSSPLGVSQRTPNTSVNPSEETKESAASVEARARAVQSSEDTSSVEAIAEQGVTTALTPRSATPPSPVTAPRPRTLGQQANDALVEALRQAWFAGRKRPVQELGKTDFALYLKRAKEMVDGGIPVTEFKLYVEHWHLVSTSKQWDLTLNSLTSNGRMAEYKAFKNYPAMSGPPASAPYDPTRDPAYAPLWNGGKK